MDTIEQAIGAEVRRLRKKAGVGQSAVAAAARIYGLQWSRALIAAIELGRKRLTLGELALLPLVLAEADVAQPLVSLRELIPTGEDPVPVSPALNLPLRIARGLLLGDDDAGLAVQAPSRPVNARALEASGDAEQKAASTLRVSPEAIVEAAHQRWGRSLTAERVPPR